MNAPTMTLLAAALLGSAGSAGAQAPAAWDYGNYCGPFYTAGTETAPGAACDAKAAASAEPVDSLDALCAQHDALYCSNDPKKIAAADAQLLKGLKSLPADPKLWPSPPKDVRLAAVYRDAAIDLIGAKVSYFDAMAAAGPAAAAWSGASGWKATAVSDAKALIARARAAGH